MKSRSQRLHVRAFTLVELVIVIAVVAILAALLGPTVIGSTDRARLARALQDVNTLGGQAARARSDTAAATATCLTDNNFQNLQSFPAPGVCGSALPRCESVTPGTICWAGPYMPLVPADPWGNSYRGAVDPTTKLITITSSGPDGVAGSSDDISWQG